MMPNISDKLADKITARQVLTERFKGSVRVRVRDALRSLEVDLINELARIDPTGSRSALVRQRRLEKLLESTRGMINRGFQSVRQAAVDDLVQYAKVEAGWTIKAINELVGVEVISGTVAPQLLREVASKSLIHGAPNREWWKGQAQGLQKSFTQQMRMGVLQGESVPKLTQRIRGTKAMGFRDGIMQTSRRNAEALARTAVQHVQNGARQAVFQDNQDVVKATQWVSTMDLRTTEICMALNGLTWTLPDYKPINHKQPFPGPTAHWNCRSTQIPVLKSFSELSKKGALRTGGRRTDIQAVWEKEAQKLGVPLSDARRLKREARAVMGGTAAKDLSFDSWLKRRSFSQQSQLLGAGKARLFADGKISMRDLIDQNNRPLSLSELIAKHG